MFPFQISFFKKKKKSTCIRLDNKNPGSQNLYLIRQSKKQGCSLLRAQQRSSAWASASSCIPAYCAEQQIPGQDCRRHCPHNKGGLAFQSSMATVRGKGWQNDSTGFTFHCKRFEYKVQLWKFSLEKVQCSVQAKRGSEKREKFSTKLTPETNRAGTPGRETGK